MAAGTLLIAPVMLPRLTLARNCISRLERCAAELFVRVARAIGANH